MTTKELASRVERTLDVVRRIIGVPDYDRYCAHLQAHHPDQTPMDREAFTRMRQADRYSRPGARCC